MNASLRTHSRFFSLGLLLGLLSLSVLAAPTVSLTAPTNAVSYLAPASVTVSASASPSSGTTITQIDFYQGSTLIGSDTTSPYSIIWSPGPGNYNLTAKATDSAGGVTTSAARTLAVNAANSAPTVSLTNPVANAIYTLPATVMLTASANGVEINTPITQVEFYQGATLIGKVSAAPYSILWSPTAAGSYGLTAKATDSAGGEKTSAVRNVSIRAANASQVYYLHTDHLDTPRLVTNESNAVVWRSQPLGEPFGNSAPEEDPDGNGVPFSMNLRFPGQYFDKETNTNYNYFRDYDPATGRYIQSDPIGLAGGINTYSYVEGNPLGAVDPFGLSSSSSKCTWYANVYVCQSTTPPPGGSTGIPGLPEGATASAEVPGLSRDRPTDRPDRPDRDCCDPPEGTMCWTLDVNSTPHKTKDMFGTNVGKRDTHVHLYKMNKAPSGCIWNRAGNWAYDYAPTNIKPCESYPSWSKNRLGK